MALLTMAASTSLTAGTALPSEQRKASDPVAVAARLRPQPVTQCSTANEQLLYFTSSSFSADDRVLVFISDRTGQPNLCRRDLFTGDERQLTHNTEGVLKSYVYFEGQPYHGLGKASVSYDGHHDLVYYIQGRQICVVDSEGKSRVLAEYPEGQVTAFTHVSSDGKLLCVPTTDARALEGFRLLPGNRWSYDIDARVRAEGLSSYLRVYDTATGKEVSVVPIPGAWVTHVQFSPIDSQVILFNHEWSSAAGTERMWVWDGHQHRLWPLRTAGEGRSPRDWACHEFWTPDGQWVIYHGGYFRGNAYVGRVRTDGSERSEIALPSGWHRYGHFTAADCGLLVSDGYYDPPAASVPADAAVKLRSESGEWISVIRPDWQAGKLEWTPLCRNGSSWNSQDAHPHPIFNHAGTMVYFTSDMDGHRAVYGVKVPKL
jgi:hypothetical protein